MSDTAAVVDWLRTKAKKILIPKTLMSAVYDSAGKRLDTVLEERDEKIDAAFEEQSAKLTEVSNKVEGKAASVHTHSFSSLTDRPSTYPPSSHSHSFNELTGRPSTYPPESHTHSFNSLTNRPSTYPPSSHSHSFLALNDRPDVYPPESHTHDDRYYVEEEVNYLINTHVHDDRYYTEEEVNEIIRKSVPVMKTGSFEFGGEGEQTINFGAAFNTPPSVTFYKSNLEGSLQGYVQVYDVTTTSCRFVFYGTGGAESKFNVNWTAIGFIG